MIPYNNTSPKRSNVSDIGLMDAIPKTPMQLHFMTGEYDEEWQGKLLEHNSLHTLEIISAPELLTEH